MYQHGLVRVAAATPALRVADCAFNASATVAQLRAVQTEGVAVVVFPELGLTGYTCADLFQQGTLLDGARQALGVVAGSVLFGIVAWVIPGRAANMVGSGLGLSASLVAGVAASSVRWLAVAQSAIQVTGRVVAPMLARR